MKYAVAAPADYVAQPASSCATSAGRFFFSSGLIGLAPHSQDKLISNDPADQLMRILDIMEQSLVQVDCTLDDIAKLGIYVIDLEDLPALKAVLEMRFSRPYPALSAVQVAALPYGARVEMECTACR